jgi:hypothetical protein
MEEIEVLRAIIEQQEKEFKSFLKKYRAKDDEMDKIFESGQVPTEKQEREFARLKLEYNVFMDYFKKYDMNIWESEDETWTPLTVAEELVREAFK